MKFTDIVRKDYYESSLIFTHDDLLNKIPKIESLFRNSKIYKNYIHSIKEGLQINNCAFFQDKDFSEVNLELHHILHLYDIVFIVGFKLVDELEQDEFLTEYDILNKVIEFHLKDYPIVAMLSSTIHQLHHTNQYDIPKDSKELHLGKYKEFISEYKEYLDKDHIIKIYKYFNIDVSEEFNEEESSDS